MPGIQNHRQGAPHENEMKSQRRTGDDIEQFQLDQAIALSSKKASQEEEEPDDGDVESRIIIAMALSTKPGSQNRRRGAPREPAPPRDPPINQNRRRGAPREPAPPRDPPIDELEGYWIKRQDFVGTKSFGVFICFKCRGERGKPGKRWQSAHAFKQFAQGCQGCESLYRPWFMWVNTSERDQNRDGMDDEEDKPHDSGRCQACRAGVCTAGRRRMHS